MVFERPERESFKNGAIILSLDRLGDYREGIECGVTAGLMIQDCAVEFLLSSKMAEDHGLGNAGGLGDFARCGTAEASLGKEADCQSENLHPPFFAGHACRASGQRGDFGGIQLLTQLRSNSLLQGRQPA